MKFFVCSLMLAIWLFPTPQSNDDRKFTRWELEIVKLEQRQQTEPVLENAILFYGSSSIRLWDSIANDMAPWPVIQRGYGGAKLPDIIHFAPRVIGPYLGADNPRRCRAVVLFVANDISGGLPLDLTPDPSPTEVAARFAKLLALIRARDQTIPVFWIEVTPTPLRWSLWPAINDATQQIRTTIEADPNTYLISTAGAMMGVDGTPRPELFRLDRLHLSQQGYQLWSALIKANLHAELATCVSPQRARQRQ